MVKKINAVENPKFQTMREISEEFFGYWVLITNKSDSPWGGIVRYYYPTRDDELWDVIMEMDKDDATYGSCMVKYIGSGEKNSIGGAFL